jgi:hypothetical protein
VNAAGGLKNRGLSNNSQKIPVVSLEKVQNMSTIEYIRKEIPPFHFPDYPGERYEALVPDTLDLQERAVLGVNGLTGPTDPEADYEIYWRVHFQSNPPKMHHDLSDQVEVKFWQALPLLRLMSGSRQDLEVEKRWMEVMLRMQGEDGMLYTPIKGRPWALPAEAEPFAGLDFLPSGDHFCVVPMLGRILGAISIYEALDPKGPWKDAAVRLTDAIHRLAVWDGDTAYLPNLIEPGKPAVPNKKPVRYSAGTFGWMAQGLVQCYRVLKYKPALELAGGLLRYIVNKSEWFAADGTFLQDFKPEDMAGTHVDLTTGVTAVQHTGKHFHAHTNTLMAVLDYVQMTGDRDLLEFATKAYRYAVSKGEPLLGFFPEWLDAKPYFQTAETCQVADMIASAVKLALLGEDSCWDDVDRWTRNQFAENQLTHDEWIYVKSATLPKCEAKFNETIDHVPERNVGAFAGWPSPNDWVYYPEHPHSWTRGIMHCCTGNGARALYYVWDNILHYRDGKLKINLLFNRASKWADVDSHIPYTGQVDVRIKEACEVAIRIPEWAGPNQCKCTVDHREQALSWDGRFALVGKVKAGRTVTLTFPISETTHELWIEKKKYTIIRKGNDVVYIDPPGENCPLYQRAHYRVSETRWRKIERFVSADRVDW